MITKLKKFVLSSALVASLAGCAVPHDAGSHTHNLSPSRDVVITVVGYGAPKSTYESVAQRRLMAMRSSEVDAYRKLAEQVSGITIFGNTSVDDFIAGRDVVRTKFNTFLQGAAIQHQEFHDDGLATTTMSLKINKSELRHMLAHERASSRSGSGLVDGSVFY